MYGINYSIIIPHKNSQDFLQYCLDTIPVRDDVQVIVVDDNSDADKVNFESFPKWKGANYEYYLTKEGKGAGYARNVGLEHAKGIWTIFADADDFFLPSFDEILNDNLNSDADIIFFRPQAVMLNDHKTHSTRADGYNHIIDKIKETGSTNQILFWMSPWSKIIKSNIIESVRFEEIKYSNDNVFSVKTICKANRIEVKDESFYMITQSNDSLTSNYLNKEGELECRSGAFLRASSIAKEKGKDIHLYYDTLKFFARELHGRDWNLYCKYISFLNKEGIETFSLLREQYNGKDRLHRWTGYANTFFHIYLSYLKG